MTTQVQSEQHNFQKAGCGPDGGGGLGWGRGVTWLGLGRRGRSSVPGQQVHQQLPLPGPGGVGVQVGVGVWEDVGGQASGAQPRGRPVSVPSPGPGYGTLAVLAFTPPQPFSRDRTTIAAVIAGMSGHRQSAHRHVAFVKSFRPIFVSRYWSLE
jgi:hypothetical protein